MVFPSARPCEKRYAVEVRQLEVVSVAADIDACIGCGRCVDSCQHRAIQMESRLAVDALYRPAVRGLIEQMLAV